MHMMQSTKKKTLWIHKESIIEKKTIKMLFPNCCIISVFNYHALVINHYIYNNLHNVKNWWCNEHVINLEAPMEMTSFLTCYAVCGEDHNCYKS